MTWNATRFIEWNKCSYLVAALAEVFVVGDGMNAPLSPPAQSQRHDGWGTPHPGHCGRRAPQGSVIQRHRDATLVHRVLNSAMTSSSVYYTMLWRLSNNIHLLSSWHHSLVSMHWLLLENPAIKTELRLELF